VGAIPPCAGAAPAAAPPLPEATRGLVEMAFGLDERPVVTSAPLPTHTLEPALLAGLRALVGDEHVRTDDAARRLRTRGKSTPDLLRARAGDLSDAPDAVVRPAAAAQVQAGLLVAGGPRGPV